MRIRLSKKYTFINFLVSTASSAFIYYRLVEFGTVALGLVALIAPLHIIASLLTFIFLFYDNLCCCCCACCLGAEEWKVFDPENHQANLVWRNGEIIDKDKEEGKGDDADNNITLKERNPVNIE